MLLFILGLAHNKFALYNVCLPATYSSERAISIALENISQWHVRLALQVLKAARHQLKLNTNYEKSQTCFVMQTKCSLTQCAAAAQRRMTPYWPPRSPPIRNSSYFYNDWNIARWEIVSCEESLEFHFKIEHSHGTITNKKGPHYRHSGSKYRKVTPI